MAGFLLLETSFFNTHFMPELPVHFLQKSFTVAFSMELGHGLFKKGGNHQSFLDVFYFWFWRQVSSSLLEDENPCMHGEA